MVVAWKAEDLRADEAADGKEPAHKVHAGGPKKAKPNEFSSLDDPRAFFQCSSEIWCRPTSTTLFWS